MIARTFSAVAMTAVCFNRSQAVCYLCHYDHLQRCGCKDLSSMLEHFCADFTLNAYTHVTNDMQRGVKVVPFKMVG